MEYIGYYINLASSVQRNQNMQQELQRHKLQDKYTRFEAIRGADSPLRKETTLNDGHLGCWESHRAIWQQAMHLNKHVHILEDDAIIGSYMASVLNGLNLDDKAWDLLFTDVFFHPPPSIFQFDWMNKIKKKYATSKSITLSNLQGLPFTATTSYVVNRNSLPKMLKLFDGKWREGKSFDTFLTPFVSAGSLRAFVILPFLTTVPHDEGDVSTIAGESPVRKVLTAFRRAMYANADEQEIYESILPCKACQESDPLLGIYLELVHKVILTMKRPGDE